MRSELFHSNLVSNSIKTDWFETLLYSFALITAALVAIPLLYMLIKTAASGKEALEILLRWRTFDIIMRSLLLAVSVTFFSVLISVPLAWLLFRVKIPARKLWLVVSIIPIVIPSYVGGYVMIAAFGPKGLMQQFLSFAGVESLPEIYGFSGAVILLTLLRFPYMLLPVSASIVRLDSSLEEASRSLGKSSFQTFFSVVLPQLKPAITAGCVFTSLAALSDFGAVSLLRYETFTWAIYLQYQSAFNFDLAAVLSVIVVVLAVFFLYAELKSRKSASFYSRGFIKRKPDTYIDPGKWKVPSLVFLILLAFTSIIAPVSVLVYWLFLGIKSGQAFPHILDMIFNSVTVSVLSAAVTVILAFPLAYLSTRNDGKLIRVAERVSNIGFALPGVVVALSVVYFGIRYMQPFYQTYLLLIAAYVILFLPVCTGTMRNLILQINTNLEDSARSLGNNRFNVMRKVTLPILKPGIAAAFIFSFLLTMRELPATLILSPFDFRTLATGIWSATSETFLAQGAMYSLVLIFIASVPMIFLMLRRIEY